MTPYVAADNVFRKTDAFKCYSDPLSIGAPPEMRHYLENRIIQAFRMGIAAGEAIATVRKKRKAKR